MSGSGSLETIRDFFPQIKNAIAELNYEATPGDVSVKTGLPILEIEHSMKELVNDYYGELKVSKDGDIVYFFPTKFRNNRYGLGKRFSESMKAFMKVLYKGFKVVYKASIMVILVLYFVIFLVLFLVMMFAGSRDDNRSSDRRGGFGGFNVFFWFWGWGGGYNDRDRDRYNNKIDEKPKKAFYKSVFEFVFGEDDPNDFLYKNINRFVARFIQNKKGSIISQELTPITGIDFNNVNIEVSKYVAKFESQPEVTENGTVVLTFPKLLTTSAKQLTSGYEKLTDATYEVPIKHNGNKGTTNFVMCLLNGFNLFMSGMILSGPSQFISTILDLPIEVIYRTPEYSTLSSIMTLLENGKFFFGIFPFVFSILFFVIPLIRILYVGSHNRKIFEKNLYKAVAVAVMNKGNIIRPDSVILPREAEEYLGNYTDKDIERILDKMASQSVCNAEFDNNGKYYDFSNLSINLKDVKEYREKNIVGKQITDKDIDFRTDKDIFDF